MEALGRSQPEISSPEETHGPPETGRPVLKPTMGAGVIDLLPVAFWDVEFMKPAQKC